MRLLLSLLVAMTYVLTFSSAASREVHLHLLHTSDVHSSLWNTPKGGLAAIYGHVADLRQTYGSRLLLTDGGDDLQGQPYAYYYNYVDTLHPHLVAEAMNAMGYDAAALGNHDVETGHATYDRFIRQCRFPVMGANVIDTHTGKPYLTPYTVVEREGLRIAFLGMLTPAIPSWLPETLWSGLRFDDIQASAKKWVKIIKERENPDLLIGIFHSGWEGGIETSDYIENATRRVAETVPGFDLIVYGHDHRAHVEEVINSAGEKVVCAGTASAGAKVVEADIVVKVDKGKVKSKHITASLTPIGESTSPHTLGFEAELTDERTTVEQWMDAPIGTLTETLRERDAYFGPSKFIDVVQKMQLDITGADLSLAAPISFDGQIAAGTLRVKDMFTLYKYENFLYTMRLTGQEIKGLLEMSYALWTNRMHVATDHALLLDETGTHFKNMTYNMDAMAGLVYDVDLTKPEGQRIQIKKLSDGRPFSLTETYTVAVNSYRGNGGGELLTRGAGISHDSLASRVVWSSDKDLRYYLMQRIKEQGTLRPDIISRWRFIPETWTKDALEGDRKALFE